VIEDVKKSACRSSVFRSCCERLDCGEVNCGTAARQRAFWSEPLGAGLRVEEYLPANGAEPSARRASVGRCAQGRSSTDHFPS